MSGETSLAAFLGSWIHDHSSGATAAQINDLYIHLQSYYSNMSSPCPKCGSPTGMSVGHGAVGTIRVCKWCGWSTGDCVAHGPGKDFLDKLFFGEEEDT